MLDVARRCDDQPDRRKRIRAANGPTSALRPSTSRPALIASTTAASHAPVWTSWSSRSLPGTRIAGDSGASAAIAFAPFVPVTAQSWRVRSSASLRGLDVERRRRTAWSVARYERAELGGRVGQAPRLDRGRGRCPSRRCAVSRRVVERTATKRIRWNAEALGDQPRKLDLETPGEHDVTPADDTRLERGIGEVQRDDELGRPARPSPVAAARQQGARHRHGRRPGRRAR